jgi:ribonuclease HI
MIRIYTDGSCIGNPGPGGYALIIVKNGDVFDIRQRFVPETTNNQMELLAVRDGIIYCIDNNIIECKIFSDSQYSVKGVNEWMHTWKKRGWHGSKKKSVSNLEIWMEVEALWRQATQKLNISLHYVQGHASNKYNNLADEKAREIVNLELHK